MNHIALMKARVRLMRRNMQDTENIPTSNIGSKKYSCFLRNGKTIIVNIKMIK